MFRPRCAADVAPPALHITGTLNDPRIMMDEPATSPMARPTSDCQSPSVINWRRMWNGRAPSVIRTPISWTRVATSWAMTP